MKFIPSAARLAMRPLLILPLIATCLPPAANAEDELMARYTFNLRMSGDHGRTIGRVTYDNPANEHPGPKGLRVNVPRSYEVERDENDVVTRITSIPHELIIRPTEEEWASEDPNAFDIEHRYSNGGPLMRLNTIARIQVDGSPMMVWRSIFYGLRIGDTDRTEKPEGEITRIEYISPEPGLGIVTRGKEIDGKFIYESRDTRIRFRDNRVLRVHRIIDETFSSETQQWKTDSDVLHEWKRLDGQWRETRAVHNPDGDAITEEWEYYSRGEKTGPDGHTSRGSHLKRHLQKDGTEVHHQYLKNGEIKETRYPDGSVRLFSELEEQVSEDTRMRTEIEKLNGMEISRVVSKFAPARHKVTTIVPGQPDQVLIREYYPPDDKEFAGSSKRTVYPDGRIKTWERTRLENGNTQLVEEYGIGDGERVIEGTRTTIIFGNDPGSGKTTERINRR